METKQVDGASAKPMSFRGLLSIKSLDTILADAEEPEYRLKRGIGALQLTLFGVGAIIGAGIFTTVGTAAAGEPGVRDGAGPALMLSFVITAIACGFTALCYAEFASMVPISGSAYTYSYATLGELVAWIIGWDLIIEYAVGNIAVAIGWSAYFQTFLAGFGLHVPDWLASNYRTAPQEVLDAAPHLFGYPIVFDGLAILIVAVITVVLVWGIRESAGFNATMVAVKILVLLFFVAVGFMWVRPENWTPFAPKGWAGISAAAAIIFFAYIGFDAVSTVAEETKEPQKNLPIGIIASLVICTLFYVLVAAVFTGLISFDQLQAATKDELAEPLTLALRTAGADTGWIIGIVAFGSVVSATAVLLVFQLGQPRIFMSMARDGLLPAAFRRVHPRFRTPHISTILTGVFVAFFAAFASIDEVVDLTNIGTLFAFILVCAGIIVLRVKDPKRPRPFRVPSGWLWTILLYIGFAAGIWYLPISLTARAVTLGVAAVVFAVSRNHIFPVLGIISCLYLIYYLPPTSWLRFAAWLNFGFVLYVLYGSVHSRLTGRAAADVPGEHDARTALVGAWLGVGGTLLLILMRGLDIWLMGRKWLNAFGLPEADRADLMGSLARHEPWLNAYPAPEMISSAASLLKAPGPWLAKSLFLILPLALNAFVLAPVVILRALRARQTEAGRARAGALWFALLSSSVLVVATVIYLLLVFAGH